MQAFVLIKENLTAGMCPPSSSRLNLFVNPPPAVHAMAIILTKKCLI